MLKLLTVLLLAGAMAADGGPEFKAPTFDHNAVASQPGLWFSKTEVSVGEYDAFLRWLQSSGRTDDAHRFAPDDSVWVRDLSFNDPYAKFYNHHEAFKLYPVVGVTKEAALAYCDYMTAQHGSMRLRGIDGKVQDVRVRFRLPSPEEWEFAAGGRYSADSNFINCYPGKIFYPRDHKGRFRLNHKLGKGDYAGWVTDSGHDWEGYMITAPIESMPPDNYLGLYHLGGNVAEMTSTSGVAKGGSWVHLQDDCRIGAVNTYERPMAWLGFRIVAQAVE